MKLTKQQLVKIIKEELNEYGEEDAVAKVERLLPDILEMAQRGVDDAYGSPLNPDEVKEFALAVQAMLTGEG